MCMRQEIKWGEWKNHQHGFCLHSWKSETRESEPCLHPHVLPGMSCVPFCILALAAQSPRSLRMRRGFGLCTSVALGERARSSRAVYLRRIAPQKCGFRCIHLFPRWLFIVFCVRCSVVYGEFQLSWLDNHCSSIWKYILFLLLKYSFQLGLYNSPLNGWMEDGCLLSFYLLTLPINIQPSLPTFYTVKFCGGVTLPTELRSAKLWPSYIVCCDYTSLPACYFCFLKVQKMLPLFFFHLLGCLCTPY